MNNDKIENEYPLEFREDDARALGEHIRLRDSIELIGMKRVGISNFLRFFLNHPAIVPTYINHGEKHIFVPIDLNDLHEIDLFPFWVLTFKRLVDAIERSDVAPAEVKTEISRLFTNSIQSRDLFLTIENLRASLTYLVSKNLLPTLFFLRFDRLKDIVNTDFFANLQGLKDATGHSLAYVFTSYRTLADLFPAVFSPKDQIAFSHPFFLKPASEKDLMILFSTLEKKYEMHLDKAMQEKLLALSGGHVQYLRLAFIVLHQKMKQESITSENIEEMLLSDERITLQSEELWESLTETEQTLLNHVISHEKISEEDIKNGKYLIKTGILQGTNETFHVFNQLFGNYIKNHKTVEKNNVTLELTKKEHLLYTILLQNINAVCERDMIIQAVWPEYEEYGVSDWTIDKLVARLRSKLKQQNSEYKILTVKTRGYKLTSDQQ